MYLAYQGPVVVAPAMNTNMWNHAATRSNLAVLRQRGVRVVEPDEGDLACGMVGPGRLAVLENIVAAAEDALHPKRDLAGETVLITAGPTEEPLDPVRFLSNRSSGRMGYALAAEARDRGARVVLISGPVALEPPGGCEFVAGDHGGTDAQGGAGAPARSQHRRDGRRRRRLPPGARRDPQDQEAARQPISLELEPTTDILKADRRAQRRDACWLDSRPKPKTCWPMPRPSCKPRTAI